ncbi:MAG: MBOAT family O-acyltransferase [Lachnospiraceae bacterium]
MVFSSAIFLFAFLPILLLVYFLIDRKLRNIVLLIASLVFYAWGEPKNVFLMLLSITVNYFLGLLIERFEKGAKFFLVISIVYNLGMLFVFKYLNFTVDIINSVAKTSIDIAPIVLPIGISFFTFQIMSYVIDVYWHNVKAQKNIINLALYISLFPQLIAGPIVRYIDVNEQITERKTDWNKIYEGFLRFTIGFAKKILIADQLSTLADAVFAGNYPSILGHWIGIIAYSLQIFFDFSGYSDMAIGLGKVFGFDFLENFNYPYISKSIKEFWRRWHISLSSWFRDYVYIPLGGSRKGKVRTYINLTIVFFLTGLWHGASYNFIVWGLFYVVFLIIERLGFDKVLEKMPAVLQHIYALIIILIGWVFFRAENLTAALDYIKYMFIPSGNDVANFNLIMNGQYWFCIAAGIFFSVPHKKLSGIKDSSVIGNTVYNIFAIAVFVIAICYMVGSGFSPFLYFRF